MRELIDGDPATGNMFTVIRDENSDSGFHIVEGGKEFENHVEVAIANTVLTGDMKWINSVDDTLRASNSASRARVFYRVGLALEKAYDETGNSRPVLARFDALAFLMGFGMGDQRSYNYCNTKCVPTICSIIKECSAMRVVLDKSVNAMYIYLADYIKPGGVAKTYPCDPIEVGGMINLNFDENGILVGIEILGASNKVPAKLLAEAELI